jgi:hypothetical protein
VTAETIREELRSWAKREAARPAERDDLIRRAIAAGISDYAIHQESRISRTTIMQIRSPSGPLAIREAARRALRNRSIDVPTIATTKDGEVRLSLPEAPDAYDDLDPSDPDYSRQLANRERSEWIGRMNWAGAIHSALTAAGIVLTASDEPHGTDLQEHLAHRSEQYVVLTKIDSLGE